jgi:hypothetical protein
MTSGLPEDVNLSEHVGAVDAIRCDKLKGTSSEAVGEGVSSGIFAKPALVRQIGCVGVKALAIRTVTASLAGEEFSRWYVVVKRAL